MIKPAFLMMSVLLLAACSSSEGLSRNKGDIAEGAHCNNTTVKEDAGMMPEDHYAAMQACINDKKDEQAVSHFALAGTETWYDAIVRPGASDERHRLMLRQALSSLDEQQKKQFWKVLNSQLRDKNSHRVLCARLKEVGQERRKRQVFDDYAWIQASEGYLHCNAQIIY